MKALGPGERQSLAKIIPDAATLLCQARESNWHVCDAAEIVSSRLLSGIGEIKSAAKPKGE